MKRFFVGLITGLLLAGGSAFAATEITARTHYASYHDVVRLNLEHQVTCVIGDSSQDAFVCQRNDKRGYLVYLDADGSAAIRRNNRTVTTCLFPEAYCTSK